MEKKYLESARLEIQNWESAGPGWLSNVSDFVMWPAHQLTQKLVPSGVVEMVSQAIEKVLGGASWAMTHTLPSQNIEKAVLARIEKNGGKAELSDRLAAIDAEAKWRWNWHLAYAASEGGVTGVTGLVGLTADIPALFMLVLRMIQEIGTCYGYDMSKREERDYVLHILRTGSADNLKTKVEALLLLKQLEEILLVVSLKKWAAGNAAKQAAKISLLSGARQLAKSLGKTLTQRKALQMLPVIGAIVGASFNATFANEIGRAAYMSYRRRWIAARSAPNQRSGAGEGTRTGASRHSPRKLAATRPRMAAIPRGSKRLGRAHV